MTVRTALRMIALVAVALVIPACDKFRGFFVPFPSSMVVADLRGSQVVPANMVTVATANATLDVKDASIDYSVSQTGLGTVTAVRIHAGSAGANGPAMFTLASGPFTNPLVGTLTDIHFTPSATVASYSHARNLLAAGDAYLLISTTANPLGEIRGQLGGATLASAKLSTAQAGVVGTGSGTATFQLNSAQDRIAVTLTFTGLTAATTLARVFVGPPGPVGTPIFVLSPGTFASPLSVTLTTADFTAGGGLLTFADAVNALLSGRLYVEIETGAPEIRGQIGPVQLIANLTGGDVVNPTASPNTGTANVVLNGTQTAVNVILNHTVSAATNILIRAAAFGANGPQIFDVDAVAGTTISPVEASLQAGHLFPQAVQSIFTFPDAVDALIVGRTFIDIFSSAATYPDGEIRGQIGP